MRVIAGSLRGRRLQTPTDSRVRPTADRVRETLFNMLAHGLDVDLAGARVADIFAGTGALGIEALSRGAAHAVFVDSQPNSLNILNANLTALQLGDRSQVVRGDARRLPAQRQPFDLLFLDPPYGQDLIPPSLDSLKAGGWISPGSVICLECAAGEKLQLPDWLAIDNERAIGDTKLIFARPGQ